MIQFRVFAQAYIWEHAFYKLFSLIFNGAFNFESSRGGGGVTTTITTTTTTTNKKINKVFADNIFFLQFLLICETV